MQSPVVNIVYKYNQDVLLQATLKQRYKRFLANIILPNSNESIVCYVPNTGSMLSLIPPCNNLPLCAISDSRHVTSKRKYIYSMEMILKNNTWVGIHSSLANNIIKNALYLNLINEISCINNIIEVKEEVKFGDSRIDFEIIKGEKKNIESVQTIEDQICDNVVIDEISALPSLKKRKITKKKSSKIDCSASNNNKTDISQMYHDVTNVLVEVKSVTLAKHLSSGELCAEFPDCVSTRAEKHAKCLTTHVRNGGHAAIIFLIQRDDCVQFTTSSIDWKYQQAIHEAKLAGVQILCYAVRMMPQSGCIEWIGRVPFVDPIL
jgi:DNA-binding sugar fermentation-stimulating protein